MLHVLPKGKIPRITGAALFGAYPVLNGLRRIAVAFEAVSYTALTRRITAHEALEWWGSLELNQKIEYCCFRLYKTDALHARTPPKKWRKVMASNH